MVYQILSDNRYKIHIYSIRAAIYALELRSNPNVPGCQNYHLHCYISNNAKIALLFILSHFCRDVK